MTLKSDDYTAIARFLAERLWGMLQAKTMVAPLAVHVTGEDDDVVMQASMTADGRLRDLSAYPEQSLTARFPVTATITDADGERLEITIEADMVVLQ